MGTLERECGWERERCNLGEERSGGEGPERHGTGLPACFCCTWQDLKKARKVSFSRSNRMGVSFQHGTNIVILLLLLSLLTSCCPNCPVSFRSFQPNLLVAASSFLVWIGLFFVQMCVTPSVCALLCVALPCVSALVFRPVPKLSLIRSVNFFDLVRIVSNPFVSLLQKILYLRPSLFLSSRCGEFFSTLV